MEHYLEGFAGSIAAVGERKFRMNHLAQIFWGVKHRDPIVRFNVNFPIVCNAFFDSLQVDKGALADIQSVRAIWLFVAAAFHWRVAMQTLAIVAMVIAAASHSSIFRSNSNVCQPFKSFCQPLATISLPFFCFGAAALRSDGRSVNSALLLSVIGQVRVSGDKGMPCSKKLGKGPVANYCRHCRQNII